MTWGKPIRTGSSFVGLGTHRQRVVFYPISHPDPATGLSMINTGVKDSVQSKRDGWTVRTKDGGLSAQFEHTVLMTEHGPEALTITKTGPQKGHKF